MKAFIGRLMCSFFSLAGLEGDVEELEADDVGDIWDIADIAPRLEDIPLRFEDIPLRFMLFAACACMFDMLLYMAIDMLDMLGTPLNILLPESTVIIIKNHLKVQLNRLERTDLLLYSLFTVWKLVNN